MKKIIFIMVVFLLCSALAGCNRNTSDKVGIGQNGVSENEKENEIHQIENMEILCDSKHLASCYTENGYYYLSEYAVELKNGTYGTHLMYMDFATKQEIYLCSNTGCKHDTEDCPAVFSMDKFPMYSTGIFVYDNKLFVLSKEMDDEGVVAQDLSIHMENEMMETEASQAILYQMNLDGTNRQKIYTFDPGIIVEDVVLGNQDGLYFVTKKLSSEMAKDTYSITTATDKKLLFLDVTSKKAKEVVSLDFHDGITWKILGCFENTLVMSGVDYGTELTMDAYIDDDAWKELYKHSNDIISVLDLNTKKRKEVYRMDNTRAHSTVIMEDMLYVSYQDTGEIFSINLLSSEEKLLCTLPQNYIMEKFENTLCCCSWDSTSDYTYYFVNVETGEMQNSPLVNKTLGWSLEFQAEIGSQVLLIYDYEADALGDGAYEITQYKYALIEKEDLYAGNADYHPIKMIGKGN